MAKVLVTGANGFLGSWVTKRLLQEGHETFALVRKTSDLSELEGVACQYRYGDVTDFNSLKEAFKGIDSVFHLAGLIAYRKSERAKMELINVQGTANVVKACEENNIRRLVHLSSVTAIGAGFKPTQILNEDSAFNLHHLNLGYFETKFEAEKLVKNSSLDSVILNPSTIYGPGDAKKGSRKNQLKAARGELKFYTSGGVSIVSVQDAVGGIISAWKKGRSKERYILSGENILIKDLLAIISKEAGSQPPQHLIPNFALHGLGMAGDLLGLSISRENAWTATLYHWFDSSKAQRELDFKPQSAHNAIAQSVKWMKDNGLLN